jgi:hypothetical protein
LSLSSLSFSSTTTVEITLVSSVRSINARPEGVAGAMEVREALIAVGVGVDLVVDRVRLRLFVFFSEYQ